MRRRAAGVAIDGSATRAVGAVLAWLAPACTLLVDTSELAAPAQGRVTGPEAGSSEAAVTAETGTIPVPKADPCVGAAFCETFDKPALGFYPTTTDSNTNVGFDERIFASAPRSARFTIEPTNGNQSPDATMTFRLTQALPRFTFDAKINIERSEPGIPGLLIAWFLGEETLRFYTDGRLQSSDDPNSKHPEIARGKWVALHAELRLDARPPSVTMSVDGVAAPAIDLASASPDVAPVIELGISEANSPTTGWIVYWDDVTVRAF